MRLPILSAASLPLLLLAALAPSQDRLPPHVASTDPLTPAEERKAFRLPPGFDAELVAAEPDINKPINMNFDARGRLWVTSTVEYPSPAKPGSKPRDVIKVLEDFGPDGRARKVTTYADGLNIPIGVLPLRDGAIVHSIPNVWRLYDGPNGRAGKREVFFGEIGHRDTHGMTGSFTWGFDGWVYACHGFANESTIKGKDGRAVKMQSGNTYRVRPDGSHIEQFTWGQVNPFGLCFDPLGNLYSADCHSQPIYQLLRGAYYPSFGKPHDGLGFGPEMITNYRGSTAIAGVVYYAADHFPKEYQGAAFIGDVVTTRVVQFDLKWTGSSPKAIQKEFLVSDDPWFRPVDVKLGPDGALYVADFYNRIIGHYEVPLDHPGRDRHRGRIWRIVYRGADGKGRPKAPRQDWTKATVKELVADLAHPNLTVRMIAANELVARGKEGVEAVRAVMTADAKPLHLAHGLWVLERCGALDDKTLKEAAGNGSPLVCVHALRVLSERAKLTPEQFQLARRALKDTDPFVKRCAADALGRHPDPDNLQPLLEARRAVPKGDTHLLHVIRMALRDNLRPAAAWKHLPQDSATLVADVALGVPTPEAAAFLMDHLAKRKQGREPVLAATRHVARHGSKETTDRLLSFLRGNQDAPLGLQHALFRAYEQGTQERGDQLSDAARGWAADLAGRLLTAKKPSDNDLTAGIVLAGSLRLADTQPRLIAIAESRKATEAQRVAALNSLVAIDAKEHTPRVGGVLAEANEPIGLREQAANTLARLNSQEAQAELLKALPTAPARLQNTIAAGLAGSTAGAEKLLEAVAQGKASARLLQERQVEVKLAQAKVTNLKERVAKLTEGFPKADQRVQELLKRRRAGFVSAKADAAAGAKVFEKNCAACHQIGGKGAKVGPQLDGIGARGLDRLLEDILDPNRNVDQAFRTTQLALKGGQVVSGLLLREEGEVLVLADEKGKEVRVPKGQVEEKNVSPLSPMPANLADQIPEAEFNQLMAYLLAQRTK